MQKLHKTRAIGLWLKAKHERCSQQFVLLATNVRQLAAIPHRSESALCLAILSSTLKDEAKSFNRVDLLKPLWGNSRKSMPGC